MTTNQFFCSDHGICGKHRHQIRLRQTCGGSDGYRCLPESQERPPKDAKYAEEATPPKLCKDDGRNSQPKQVPCMPPRTSTPSLCGRTGLQ